MGGLSVGSLDARCYALPAAPTTIPNALTLRAQVPPPIPLRSIRGSTVFVRWLRLPFPLPALCLPLHGSKGFDGRYGVSLRHGVSFISNIFSYLSECNGHQSLDSRSATGRGSARARGTWPIKNGQFSNLDGVVMLSIMVCGSRDLSAEGVELVRGVVRSVMGSGRSLLVGCAVGVDAVALDEGLRVAADRVSLFSAFGPGGAGAVGKVSNVAGVVRAAAVGVAVEWWAGGLASVPVRARLANRSLSAVRAVSGSGGVLVAVVNAPPPRSFGGGAFPSCGSGSWSSVAAAVQLGVPVVVFPVGFPSRALPSLPVPGQWVSAGSGVWSGGWKWSPKQAVIF